MANFFDQLDGEKGDQQALAAAAVKPAGTNFFDQLDEPETSTFSDVAQSLDSGLVNGIPNAIDGTAAIGASIGEHVTNWLRPGTFADPSIAENMKNAVIGPALNRALNTSPYKSQTYAGEIADAAGEGIATSVLAPVKAASAIGMAAKTAGVGALSGAGGKIVGDVGKELGGQTGQIVGSVLGGMIAPGAVGIAQAYRGGASQLARHALEGSTPADIAGAQALQDAAAAKGYPLMAPQALDNANLQRIAGDARASDGGGQIINAAQIRQGENVQPFANRLLDDVAPAAASVSDVANHARVTATSALNDLQRARTQASSPFYKAAESSQLDTMTLKPVLAKIDQQIKASGAQSKIGGELLRLRGQLTQDLKPDTVATSSVLDANGNPIKTTSPAPNPTYGPIMNAYEELRDRLDLPLLADGSLDKRAKGVLGPISSQIRNGVLMRNANYVKADAIHQALSGPYNQARSLPLGKIAGDGVDATQPATIQDVSAPLLDHANVRPEDIQGTYTAMNAKDPTAFPNVVRGALNQALDNSLVATRSGLKASAAFNFANKLYGTPQQQANLQEMMRGVASANGIDPDQAASGLHNAMTYLQRTSRMPGVGSPTAGRLNSNMVAEQSLPAALLEAPNILEGGPLRPIAGKLRQYAMYNSYKQFANAITAPDGVSRLADLAGKNVNPGTLNLGIQAIVNGANNSVSPNYADKVIDVESGGRSNARSSTSSATGAGQFTAQTWLGLMRQTNPQLFKTTSVPDILAMRNDPNASRQAVEQLAQQNAQTLKSANLPVSDTTLYLAHFLGANGARNLLKANPKTPVSQVVNRGSISANPSVLAGKTAGQVYQWAQKKMGQSEHHLTIPVTPANMNSAGIGT